ncbi:MAG TPA: hypothetical protein VJ836_06080 [Candidatus Saccharimonadales bacterium]|nr:hypothetical protein [Candidatus Saccharimonadales bacterium]
MGEVVKVRTREERVAAVRKGESAIFQGPWFDAAPDYYKGSFDPSTIYKETSTDALPLTKYVMELTVEPPIDEADETALGRHGDLPDEMVRDILSSRRGTRSVMILEALEFQPPQVTAARALDALNHVHDYRLSVGVYALGNTPHSVDFRHRATV